MSTNKAPQAAKTVKVTLRKPHTHAGVNHPAGTELDVDTATAQWLQANQVIDPQAADAAKA